MNTMPEAKMSFDLFGAQFTFPRFVLAFVEVLGGLMEVGDLRTAFGQSPMLCVVLTLGASFVWLVLTNLIWLYVEDALHKAWRTVVNFMTFGEASVFSNQNVVAT